MAFKRVCRKCGYKRDMPSTYGRSGTSVTPLVKCPSCRTRNFVLKLK